MAKGKKQFRRIEDIMNNPSDKKKLTNFIDEAVIQRDKVKFAKDDLKAITDEAKQQLEINPKLFNSLVAITAQNSFIEKREEILDLESAIAILCTSIDSSDSD